ncbi:MAG TPA: energy-coupling factor transporter transmembrane component T [candidate division Zixibacteria bacterium]|nr:energy-coupling factor transporter transmembrane component T [candidate division Zixibacteria bacterium]
MRLFTPLRPRPEAFLARANPAAKLGAAAILMVALFVSADVVTATIVLAGLLAAVPASGLAASDLLNRTWPILLAALSVGVLNAVFAAETVGEVVARIGPFGIGTGNLVSGLGLGLRLLGIALSGVLALVTTDPTDLADSLVQQLRLPSRFAIGALAAARQLPILATEWQTLSLARRARGVEAGRSPVEAMRLFASKLLALLIAGVRRGTRLAMAMESRGFGTRACRSVARPQVVRQADWALIGAAAVLGVAAIGISVGIGTWEFIFS